MSLLNLLLGLISVIIQEVVEGFGRVLMCLLGTLFNLSGE